MNFKILISFFFLILFFLIFGWATHLYVVIRTFFWKKTFEQKKIPNKNMIRVGTPKVVFWKI